MAVLSYGVGRYATGEADVLITRRTYRPDGTRRGIIYCHGAGERAISLLNSNSNKTEEAVLFQTLAEAGFPLVACDLGTGTGTTTGDSWGNTNAQARVADAITWLQSPSGGGAKTGQVLMLGISMGNSTMINYAKNNPSNVAAMVGIIPVSDLDDIRNNDRNSYRSWIDTAYGVTYPAALPAGANPATSYSGAVGIPYKTWYAADDTIVMASTVLALTAAIGGTATSVGNLGHSNAAVGAVPISAVIDFFLAHS